MTERRITAEAVKAETAIRRAQRARDRSIRVLETRWATKLRALYNSFPDDVTRVLLATGVIETPDLDPDRLPLEEP